MSYTRFLIIANKWFEADPLMDVLSNATARPPVIQDLGTVLWPRAQQTKLSDIIVRPRCAVNLGGDFVMEVWCLQDLMNPFLSYANTAEKIRVLPQIFTYGKMPDFVMAFGTAATPSAEPGAGNVVIGPDIFIHNPFSGKPNPASAWNDPAVMEKRLRSSVAPAFFRALDVNTAFQTAVSEKLLTPPLCPASPHALNVSSENVAVSDINVTSTSDYTWADPESLAAASAAGISSVASMETTHGTIRAQSEAPFLFVSGITNQVGQFGTQVVPKFYAQNFVASHNAAIAVAWLIPEIMAYLKAGEPPH